MSMALLGLMAGAAALFLAKGKSGGGRTPRRRAASGRRPEEFRGGVPGGNPNAQPAQLVTRSTNAPGAATIVPPAAPLSDPNTGEPFTYVRGVAGPTVLEYGEVNVNMNEDGTARAAQPLIAMDARGVVTVGGGLATHHVPGVGRVSRGGEQGHEGVNLMAPDALEVIRAQAFQVASGTPAQRSAKAKEAVAAAAEAQNAIIVAQDTHQREVAQGLHGVAAQQAQRRADQAWADAHAAQRNVRGRYVRQMMDYLTKPPRASGRAAYTRKQANFITNGIYHYFATQQEEKHGRADHPDAVAIEAWYRAIWDLDARQPKIPFGWYVADGLDRLRQDEEDDDD